MRIIENKILSSEVGDLIVINSHLENEPPELYKVRAPFSKNSRMGKISQVIGSDTTSVFDGNIDEVLKRYREGNGVFVIPKERISHLFLQMGYSASTQGK